MLFHEWTFLFVFLPLVFAAVHTLNATRHNGLLLFASCVFYAISGIAFLPLLLLSTVADYVIGGRIARSDDARTRKAWLSLSLFLNLGLLCTFKYIGLITETLASVLSPEVIPVVRAALPVGISFFTFQSMSYSIDLYRRQIQPARSLVDFACYVTLFPQLVAGPIVRYAEMETALVRRSLNVQQFAEGCARFIQGLAKKVLLADTAALLADPLLAETAPSLPVAWVGILLFAAQIYFDFSGYSDMAIGIGRCLGFEFPENFHHPYLARSIAGFWRRWHMTLSRWLRDNLYIPLGGNRRGSLMTARNLAITMLLGGLWHGASWNYLIWGGLWGALLGIERVLGDHNPLKKLPAFVQIAVVFFFTLITWVFFRLENLADAMDWTRSMFLGDLNLAGLGLPHLLALAWTYSFVFLFPRSWTNPWRIERFTAPILCLVFALSLVVAYGRVMTPFLYFRF